MEVKTSDFVTRVSSRRQPSAIRALQPLVGLPGMISLGGGLPNPDAFPITGISLTLSDGSQIPMSDEQLNAALQYGPTRGQPLLVNELIRMMNTYHHPKLPWDECLDILVSSGSQDALSRTFDMLLDENSAIIVEKPTYPGALAAIVPIGCTILGVETDGNGLIPESLKNVIEEHHRSGDGTKIKALYTIPTGQNPRGCTTTVERKEEVFRICHDANILILEDDPYYFLRYDFFDGRGEGDHWAPPRSYLSMDEDGRVLRFDSFSKIMSSGIRLGWATGPKPFIERLNLHMQAGSLHACSLSQVIVGEMLRLWGREKFESHIQKAQLLYRNRMLKFKEFMETHLDGLVEWDEPVAGMFAWMRLKGVKDTKKLVMEDCRERGVLMVPGNAFYADGDAPSPYVRASFSVAPLDKLEEAVRRLASLLRERS